MSMLACHGCEDFTCVRGLTLRSIPTEDDLILQWMKQHKLVWDEISKCRCGGRVVERRGHLECTDRGCRGRYPLLGPLLDSWQRCSPQKIIALLYCCAVGIGHKVAKREVSVANGTVQYWVRKVERAALWYCETHFERCKRGEVLVIDETCFASRKYHRGHRVRESGPQWWFSAVIVDAISERVLRGCMYHVADRKAQTLRPYIDRLLVARGASTVISDAWRAYMDLGVPDIITHHVVNHSESFVNEEGWHTNWVEGYNGLVKRFLRGYAANLGQFDATMEGKVALAVCHVNDSINGVDSVQGFFCVLRAEANGLR